MAPKVEGTPVKIGGREFLVPALTIGAWKTTKADRAIVADTKTSDDERMDAAMRLIHATLIRNYPDLSIEEVEQLIPYGGVPRILGNIAKAWRVDEGGEDAGKAAAGSPQT